MKGSFGVAALVAAMGSAVQAAPMPPPGINDAVILNYALTLEHLEDTFYRQALQNFTEADFMAAGFDSFFYQRVQDLSTDEKTHVDFLTTGLMGELSSARGSCIQALADFAIQLLVLPLSRSASTLSP